MENNEIGYEGVDINLNQSYPVFLHTHQTSEDSLKQMHSHNVQEIGLCLQGRGVFILNNSIYTYQKGDMIFVNKNIYHRAHSSLRFIDKWKFIYFDIDLISHAEILLPQELFLPFEDNKDLFKIFQILIKEFEEKNESYQEISLSLIIIYLKMLKRNCGKVCDQINNFSKITKDIDFRIIKAVNEMIDNISNPPRIEILAELSNLSPSRFRNVFKEQLGLNPKSFQLNLSILKATELLKDPKYKVEEICELSGYNSISGFNKHFKAQFGISPIKYRKNYLKSFNSRF